MRSDEQWEFLKHIALLIMYADSLGYKLTGGDLKRTVEEQAVNVTKGLSKTMDSMHIIAQAQDFNIFFDYDKDGDKDYINTPEEFEIIGDKLGKFWMSLSDLNQCGFAWQWDRGHFERRS